ncbi:MAG TPA: peptidylprolyl isomerase [Polyangiaceae bacterium]|nr:peptidylprolyl isomerase [Polyangiaceae bacterium]
MITRPRIGWLALLLCGGCGSLATTPSWVGGGMAVIGPLEREREEAEAEEERVRMASEPDEIGARHILVMHAGSQAKPEEVSRTKEEARARAAEALRKIREGADFTEMVRQYSDEPGAAERGGDLGMFRREVMVKNFSDAAFGLKVGEVSEVVETAYGFHIIKRTR